MELRRDDHQLNVRVLTLLLDEYLSLVLVMGGMAVLLAATGPGSPSVVAAAVLIGAVLVGIAWLLLATRRRVAAEEFPWHRMKESTMRVHRRLVSSVPRAIVIAGVAGFLFAVLRAGELIELRSGWVALSLAVLAVTILGLSVVAGFWTRRQALRLRDELPS